MTPLIPFDLAEMQAASRACERVRGHAPVFTRGGGSIPIVYLEALAQLQRTTHR